jgi:glutathione peroxidase
MASVFDFSAVSLAGQPVELAQYHDKVLLIVNTASACGFTPQYAGLEKLHERFQARGFAVLGFPCNQFGKQEPGTEEEIGAFCESRFAVTFPLFAKVDVNGPDAHPLWQFLKHDAPGLFGTESIKWNFTKFLIRRDGTVAHRYAPTTKPEDIARDIEALLAS